MSLAPKDRSGRRIRATAAIRAVIGVLDPARPGDDIRGGSHCRPVYGLERRSSMGSVCDHSA